MQLAASEGENSHSVGVLGIGVAVEETVEFFAVAMEVQNEADFSLSADLLDECFDGCDFRAVGIFFGGVPFSVEVLAAEVGAIVAIDHTVGIDHWNDIDHVVLQQKVSLLALAHQFIDDSFADIRSLGFARMLPRHHNNCLPVISLLVQRLTDHQPIYRPFGQCLPSNNLRDDFLILCQSITDIFVKFFESIRIRMRNVQFILLKHGTQLEA